MSSKKNIFVIAGSIIIAGIIMGVAILYVGAQKSKQQQANLVKTLPMPPDEKTIASNTINVKSEGYPFIGKENAPITIIGVGDFECPFCKKFVINTFPKLKEDYIDKGIIKFVFRDFPLPYHPFSQKAAEAALCVYDQNKSDYYDYYTVLYKNSDALKIDDLKKYAKESDINISEFNKCLDEGKFEDNIKESFEDINKVIQQSNLDNFGTPGFFINGKPFIGAQPFSAFQDIIEEDLTNLGLKK